MTLKERLQFLFNDVGISKADFAKRSGYSIRTISRCVNEDYTPSSYTTEILEQTIQTYVDQIRLLGKDDSDDGTN